MARPKYPSDDKPRIRVRPHVKMHLSLRGHDKTSQHFDDPEFRGQLVALFMLAMERYAAKNGGELHLSRSDFQFISGRSQFKVGLKLVRSLLEVMGYSHKLRGKVLVTWIPKFAEKQGITAAESAHLRAAPDSQEKEKEKEKEKESITPPNSDLEPDPPPAEPVEEIPKRVRTETKDPPPKPKPRIDTHPEAAEICGHMLAELTAHVEGFKPPTDSTKRKWATDMDRLLRIDKAPPDLVREVISWAARDSFWSGNVLCPEKLRKKWPTLLAKMKHDSSGGSHSETKLERIARHGRESEARDYARNNPGHSGDPADQGLTQIGTDAALLDLLGESIRGD